MKRIFSFMLIMVLLVSLSAAAFADDAVDDKEWETYELSNIGISICIPEKYSVITADTPEDARDLEELALDKEMSENVLAYYEAELFMSATDLASDLIIRAIDTQEDSEADSLNELSSSQLNKIAFNMLAEYEKNGFIPAGSTGFSTETVNFIKLYYGERNQDGYVDKVEYLTVHNGQTLSFTFSSYEKMVDQELESIYDDIMNTVLFEKA